MILYLMRHGTAEDFAPGALRSDADRGLTDEGEEKMRRQAKRIAALDLGITRLITSPYVRARQSADIVHAELDERLPLSESQALVPHAPVDAILQDLAARDYGGGNIMLFGHEPHLSSLGSFVLSAKLEIAIEMKKGALLGLELTQMEPPFRGALVCLIPPRALRV